MYIHTDALGSVVAESDASGNVIKRYHYEPYGAVVGGQVEDGPGYTGHVSDAATELSYMQQRYYDPQVGLFLSVDPVTAYGNPVDQFNRYRYGNGSPYKFKDPGTGAGRWAHPSSCTALRCISISATRWKAVSMNWRKANRSSAQFLDVVAGTRRHRAAAREKATVSKPC